MPRPTNPSTERLTTPEAAELINSLARQLGSRRRVRPHTLRDWRTDRKGPAYVKVSGHFIEYDREELVRFVREEFTTGRRFRYIAVPA